MLDPRYGDAWAEFAASGAAIQDRERFLTSLYRSNFPHVFPPPVFSADSVTEVATLGVTLARLIAELPTRVFADDLTAWMDFLGVPPADRELLVPAIGHSRLRRAATTFIRPDLISTTDGLKAVEINVSAPIGGMNTHDPYVTAFNRSEYGRFLESRGLAPVAPDMSGAWLAGFGGLLRTSGETGQHVFEGVANPADIDSGRRFFVEMLRSGGYDVSSGLMSELEVTDSGVLHAGRTVDVVFTMYTWHETKKFVPPSLTRSLIELDAAGLVDFVGSPASALFDNKANLELLTDHQFDACFTEEERAVLRRHVPATFRLTPNTLDRALTNQTRLVCKPASAYGGRDIVFGADTTTDTWRSTVENRLRDSTERYVCQERITPAVAYHDPAAPDGVEVCFGPMIYGSSYAGTLVRQVPAKRAAVINVTQGAEASVMLCGTPMHT
ncbi:hypothetical protein [Amycolatopsis anabasis]|uniref:hypothetical protein n=1 Tax=Amycolatopsis anabasis TaxID=1840409 RepID=UPI00131CA0FE|nr:hypothetical protein [Amycolatopsis anabasis]